MKIAEKIKCRVPCLKKRLTLLGSALSGEDSFREFLKKNKVFTATVKNLVLVTNMIMWDFTG